MILNDKIIFSINRACKSSHPGGRPEARREGGLESDGAEHVIVGAHRVVVHEQLASVIDEVACFARTLRSRSSGRGRP